MWIQPTPPTLTAWMADINATLPYKRVIYINRGCPTCYHKIWDRWLEASVTCTPWCWYPMLDLSIFDLVPVPYYMFTLSPFLLVTRPVLICLSLTFPTASDWFLFIFSFAESAMFIMHLHFDHCTCRFFYCHVLDSIKVVCSRKKKDVSVAFFFTIHYGPWKGSPASCSTISKVALTDHHLSFRSQIRFYPPN